MLLDEPRKTLVEITEEDSVTLNCTKDFFDGKHKWSRKDGKTAETETRILTKDTRLRITKAKIADAGVYECRNAGILREIFIVKIKGELMGDKSSMRLLKVSFEVLQLLQSNLYLTALY